MKIYIQDHTWSGATFVIANSTEEAREIMKSKASDSYIEGKEILEFDIENGFCYDNMGDS